MNNQDNENKGQKIVHYLIPPTFFSKLCSVYGFSDMNGKTYGEHVSIIMEKHLESKDLELIKNLENNDQQILNYLKSKNILFTHVYCKEF
jgi:hypothetical protein